MGGCPMGYGEGVDAQSGKCEPAYLEVRKRILRRLISCRVAVSELEKCRVRMAVAGQGSCVPESRMRTLCVETQRQDRERAEAACLPPGRTLSQLEYEYTQCFRGKWFWQDCLGPLRDFAQCAENLSQRPSS